jgi:hypothetical protein
MERENPLEEWNEIGLPSDETLAALFKSLEEPAPSSRFLAQTMRAVKRVQLPAGRRPLRSPFTSLIGWAAAIAIMAFSVWTMIISQPLLATGFGVLVTKGIGIGVWLVQFAGTGSALLNVFASMGLAFSKAAVTIEGTTGLLLTAALGAFALSTLHRLLMSDAEGSSWQEVS